MRLVTALFATGVLFMSGGCVIVSDPGGGGGNGGGVVVERADLTVLYTFGGRVLENAADCTDAGISTVWLEVVGVGVTDGTVKEENCSAFFQGMTVRELMVGDYDVTVIGKGSGGAAVYAMASPARVAVAANTGGSLDVDAPSLFGSLTLWWNSFGEFSGANRCTQAAIKEVRVVLYDSGGLLVADEFFNCTQEGVLWDFLAPGSYEVILNGLDWDGYVIFSGERFVTVGQGQDNSYDIDLDKIVGDLTMFWRFNGSTACGAVTQIQVTLYDPWDDIYDNDVYPCSSGGISYVNVYGGEWLVVLEGLGSNNQVLFRTPQGGTVVPVIEGTHAEYYVDLY